MKIKKIVIRNYKSIKEPVEINFTDSLPTVLIGKNGSGKTNILEALSAIAEANENYFGIGRDTTFDYEVHMQLSDEDVAELFPGKNIDASKCNFVAYPGENIKINRIESEYLVPLLNAEAVNIKSTAEELKKAVGTYKKQLEKTAYGERKELPIRGFEIEDFKNSTTSYDLLKYQVEFTVDKAEKFADSILSNFENGETAFNFNYVYNYYHRDDMEKLKFKLKYVKPDLAPFESKFITINETAIKREITKINKATKDSCEKITKLVKQLDECANRLKGALNSDSPASNETDTFYKFVREIRKCIGARCSFLKNENSNVIFKDEESERQYYRNDDSFVILQTYINKVYDGADKNELLNKLKSDKDFSLPDKAITDFEAYLNKNRPVFENEMYEKISARKAGKSVEIFLHEKSGEVVSLNSTSSGRRWYFTYYFTKNALEKGDLLIVDEPASSLHPLAQKEVLKELCDLEKQGVQVIYSTHSPYLIPDEWKCVHFVSMEESGTTVTKENYFDSMKEIADGDVFNLQEIAEKYKYGDTEKIAHNCYQAAKTLGKVEQAADKLGLSVDTLEAWRKSVKSKKFKTPKLENVLIVAQKTNTDVSILLE